MRLEFVRIEEANDLINQLIEHHPHPIFVTDHLFKINYFNKAFQKLTQREKYEILGKEFCETLACTQRGNLVTDDLKFCKHCQMRELLAGSLSELELIRDFQINNETVTKHFFITSHKVVMREEKYRLVVIDDRTQAPGLFPGK